MFTLARFARIGLLVSVPLASGCEDSTRLVCRGPDGARACEPMTGAPTGEPPARDAEPSGDARPLEPAPNSEATATSGAEPAFLLGTRIFDDSSITSYFHVLPSLEAGVEVDAARALEAPGSAKLYSVPGLGWFALGGGEAPTITRYTIGADNQLLAGESISLSAYGVQGLWDTLYVVSPTKAYYPDRAQGQLIAWNPSTMQITGSIALPETLRPGYLALYGYAPILRGTQLLISVGWFDWDVNDSVLGETGLLVLDTTTDTVQRFDVDPRCGGITQPIATSAG